MIQNRLKRILYPFLTFLFVLWPFIVVAWIFTGGSMNGNANSINMALKTLTYPLVYIPQNTFHLWFLNYLIYFVAFSWVIALLMKKLSGFSRIIKHIYALIFRYTIISPFIFALFTILFFYFLDVEDINHNVSHIPDWKPLLLYSIFYFWGWLLFKSKDFLGKLILFDYLFLIIAIALYVINSIFYNSISHIQHMMLNAAMKWTFVFGIMGMFMRFFSAANTKMRYISDSSYWIYLIHLPLTAFIPGLLINLNLPAGIKFLIVLSVTSIFCLLTYHYFVRSTFIGKFLNGRKYPLKSIRK